VRRNETSNKWVLFMCVTQLISGIIYNPYSSHETENKQHKAKEKQWLSITNDVQEISGSLEVNILLQ